MISFDVILLGLALMLNMSEEKKKLVSELLRKHSEGLTIVEISKFLKISRNTVAVALAELTGGNLIRIRPVGKAKLHYWLGRGGNS